MKRPAHASWSVGLIQISAQQRMFRQDFAFFLSHSRQIMEHDLKLGHDLFFHINHRIVRRYEVGTAKMLLNKPQTNKTDVGY
jgi:hypothetical protein